MNKRQVGTEYEAKAIEYLQKHEVIIRQQNFRCRSGEVDIIGVHKGYLVFFEVKYRKNNAVGYPEEAVGYYKQKRICSVADYYRYIHGYSGSMPMRYDVIAICQNEIRWYQNAFSHVGNY